MTPESQVQNPYIGPRPFERKDSELFFGRDREVDDIISLIVASRTLLLYAQSGAGKTSLVNAKVIPLLEEEGFEVFPIARVRGLIPEGVRAEEVSNLYVFNTLMNWAEDKTDLKRLSQISVAGFLNEREHIADKAGRPLPRVIIFDQLEELFTFYPERWKEREGFFRQLAEVLEKDPLLRVLFIIREDYLADLDPYVRLLPGQLRARYHVERLRPEAACHAIEGPLGVSGRSFAEGVASKLVEQLLNIQVKRPNGKAGVVPGEYVEPVQLQVVCRNLWSSLPPDVTEITLEHIETFGDVDKALRGFYERAIKAAERKTKVKEKHLRNWFESQLITPVGTRGTVFQGKVRTGGIRNEAVDVLEKQHIIRAEMRARARWYELTHDRLIEPIRASNHEWCVREAHLRRQRIFRVAASGAVIFMLIIISAAIWVYDKELSRDKRVKEELDRINKRINTEINKVDKERETTEQVLAVTVNYWWKEGELDILAGYLKKHEPNIPKNFGVSLSPNKDVPPVPSEKVWPLILEYNPARNLDQQELLGQWQLFAARMCSQWGIPAPARFKLKEDPNLPVDMMNVIAYALPRVPQGEPQQTGKGAKSVAVQTKQFKLVQEPIRERLLLSEREESFIERKFSVPYRAGHVLITEAGLPEGLRGFFDQYKKEKEWILLPQLKQAGPWWLVPRWTQPLWKIGGQDAYPPEAAITLIMANFLLDAPDLVLTRDCVGYLLERVREQSPQTVAEALTARGGVNGIQQDIIEVVRQHDYPLTRLTYLLDALANCSGLAADEAANRAVDSQIYATEDCRLQGSQARSPGVSEDRLTKLSFRHVYAEAGVWLPDLVPPIRVYLGGSIEKALVTKESRLVPEVLEALVDLRGDTYKRFGVDPPSVRFRSAEEELADDAIRIEMVNQSQGNEDAKPIELTPDRALEQLLRELRFRYVGLRTWWLTAEKIHWELVDLPAYLRKWLEAHYSLTDIKLILRAVIAPTEEELNVYAEGGWTEDGLRQSTPQQTLRDMPWLLGSLTFWANMIDPLDAQQIAEYLRRTQGARLDPNQDSVVESKATDYVRRGIEELADANVMTAEETFKKAVELDRDAALKAFLILYPKESRLAVENRLAWLEGLCTLPDPGSRSTKGLPDMQTRYELEEFLNDPTMDIPVDARRRLRLCLLWNYFEQEHYAKRDELLEQLLSEYDPNQWSPVEEYFLAYRMLTAHAERILRPDRLDWIEKLLLSAFERLPDEQADNAFRELMRVYSTIRAPTWYVEQLHSLVELRPQSYWIPYRLGEYLANGADPNEAEKALDLLKQAESNLSRTELDPNKEHAWIYLKKARAYLTLAGKGPKYYEKESYSKALKLYETLIENVENASPRADGWPDLLGIYQWGPQIYIDANKIQEANSITEKGLSLFPDNEILLQYSGQIYHEHLFEYETAYEKYKHAFDLKPKDSTNRMNFAEANLTTGRFKEAHSLAQRVLEKSDISSPLSVYQQLAMRFIMISSLFLQGRTDEAHEELKEFISHYNSVLEEYEPGWSYEGSKNFIKQQQMVEKERKLILKLIEVLEKKTSNITMEQFIEP